MCVRARLCLCVRAYVPACVRACVRACERAYMLFTCTYILLCICAHACKHRAAQRLRGYASLMPLLFPDFITRPLSRIVGGAVRRRVDARDGQPDAAADARARGLLHGGDRQGATPRSCHATPRCVAPWCHVQRASSQRRSASHDAARCRVAREYRCHPRGVVVHLRETLTARWQRAKMNRVFREVL